MADLNKLTIAEARNALRKGDVTSIELTEACLTQIEGAGALNAFVHDTSDLAREQAAAADARVKAGDAPDLCGIPLGIKDLFCTKGVPSQAASGILEGFRPEYESTVTQNLFDAGAVMLGKLNMDEFAMGVQQRDLGLWQCREPLEGGRARADAGRVFGWFGGCRCGRSLPWGDRHRYRRLDPPACGLHRDHRDQAHLRALFALGDCCLCQLARSGGADGPYGSRLRDHARSHVRP